MTSQIDIVKQYRSIRVIETGEDGFSSQLLYCGANLLIIASWGGGWDHVSVSLEYRLPNWDEMQFVKYIFFRPTEVAMQLHPAVGNYVNNHTFCLHIWRPQNQEIPIPPKAYV